ncbi:MAG: class I mannose-6-phosphate isomerase [Phycisphaerales bacterium]|nr:class I mannose-6-phosphate isomerase [Phycisphaerales bacterium]
MNDTPRPIALRPIFKPKPWGGRSLARLFNKPLPPDEPIGESWEVADLPGDESLVRDGPFAGVSLHELMSRWGERLLGRVTPVNGRFPLLVKLLDAREALSVQVHPRPQSALGDRTPGIKHEAWYVLAADHGAEILAGLNDTIDAEWLKRQARSKRVADGLRRWPVAVGDCYYLPSGTLHALGAGVVVAEVQTPSDVTYRLYDWGRVDATGRPRALHFDAALANVRDDIRTEQILQPIAACPDIPSARRVCTCERFTIDRASLAAGAARRPAPAEMQIMVLLSGATDVRFRDEGLRLRGGDCCIIPAECASDTVIHAEPASELLLVRGGHLVL